MDLFEEFPMPIPPTPCPNPKPKKGGLTPKKGVRNPKKWMVLKPLMGILSENLPKGPMKR